MVNFHECTSEYEIRYSCFTYLSCSDAGTINILFFIVIPSMITISSLNDQNGCSSICAFTFVDGQLHSTYSERIHKYSSFIVANLLSSAVLQSVMSAWPLHCRVLHMPDISTSLFALWLHLDSQSAMKSGGLVLYGTHLLCWRILKIFFAASVLCLQHPS